MSSVIIPGLSAVESRQLLTDEQIAALLRGVGVKVQTVSKWFHVGDSGHKLAGRAKPDGTIVTTRGDLEAFLWALAGEAPRYPMLEGVKC
jgi:hypothetical protein